MNRNSLVTDKVFMTALSQLAIPIIIQNILSAAVNSADVVMLNFVGQSSISAVSLAANYSTVLFMVYNGLGTGAALLCAQYNGKGDSLQAIRIVEGIALRFSLLCSALFSLAVLCVPEWMMQLFTNDPELIAIGAGYLRVMAVTYLCWGIVEVYLAILRSLGQVKISMALNILAFVMNVLLNAAFIFGLFGLPKLGATGVAIATAASRAIELAGCFLVSRNNVLQLDLRYLFLRSRVLFDDFIRLSLPALANDVIWGVGFSMYSVILGHLGSDAVAANSLVAVVRNIGSVFCFGVADAGGILLGNIMGQGNLEKSRDYASKVLKSTIAAGALGGVIILTLMPFVLRFASLDGDALRYLKYMLLINSYYIMGAAVNTVLIAGVFRAGGDTRFGLVCDTVTMWCYAVPLGFIAAFVLKLPVLWVYFLLCTDEFAKWPWVIRHYRRGSWAKNITRENILAE